MILEGAGPLMYVLDLGILPLLCLEKKYFMDKEYISQHQVVHMCVIKLGVVLIAGPDIP